MSLLNYIILIRYNKRRPGINDSSSGNIDLPDVETPATSADLVTILYDLINKLLPFDKAILMLWLEKKSYSEISDILGISEKNVSVKIVRIKEQLRKLASVIEIEN